MAYIKRIILATQLRFVGIGVFFLEDFARIMSTKAPENNLRMVKLEASIELFPRASLHNIEFAAKAINASTVSSTVFIG